MINYYNICLCVYVRERMCDCEREHMHGHCIYGTFFYIANKHTYIYGKPVTDTCACMHAWYVVDTL